MNSETMKRIEQGLAEAKEQREADKWIAMNVMGLPEVKLEDEVCPECGGETRFCGTRARCFGCDEWIYSPYRQYTTTLEPDYETLCKVRDTWDVYQTHAFENALYSFWHERWSADETDRMVMSWQYAALYYQPGDYSHAAYLTLTKQEATEHDR